MVPSCYELVIIVLVLCYLAMKLPTNQPVSSHLNDEEEPNQAHQDLPKLLDWEYMDSSFITKVQGEELSLECLVPKSHLSSCQSGWLFNGEEASNAIVVYRADETGTLLISRLKVESLDLEHAGSYQCFSRTMRMGKCFQTASNHSVVVKVEMPSSIMIEDFKAQTFHCRQEIIGSLPRSVWFTLIRKDLKSGKETVLTEVDFERVTDVKTNDQAFEQTFYGFYPSKNTQHSDNEFQRSLTGVYFCRSPIGSPPASIVPVSVAFTWVNAVLISHVDRDGAWSSWSEGKCNHHDPCGQERRSMIRTRSCNSPSRLNEGEDCVGQSMENVKCPDFECPPDSLVICSNTGTVLNNSAADFPRGNLLLSWTRFADCSSIRIIDTIINLSMVFEGLRKKCKVFEDVENLEIFADIVVVDEDLTIEGLSSLRIYSNHFVVMNGVSHLSFTQRNREKGARGDTYNFHGQKGQDGQSGIDGAKLVINTHYLVIKGDLIIKTQGGNGGDGGDGSHGKNGQAGLDGQQDPRWYSGNWDRVFRNKDIWKCSTSLMDGR